jgi:hypothetical protein
MLAAKTPLDELEILDPEKFFLVRSPTACGGLRFEFEERMTTARHFRLCFPG